MSPRLDYFDADKPHTPVRGNLRGKLKIKVNAHVTRSRTNLHSGIASMTNINDHLKRNVLVFPSVTMNQNKSNHKLQGR